MRRTSRTRALACAALFVIVGAQPSLAQQEEDETFWPCIQRKVPELSLPQIWTGPEIPEEAGNWQQDPDIPTLASELAARRVPIEEAQKKIRDFSASLPDEERRERMLMLFQSLFDRMNRERSEIMSGIERYARGQAELATVLRRETAEMDVFRQAPDSDPAEVAERTRQLEFQLRVFQERAQSLTYVCEVPALIERRLYQLANTISGLVAKESDSP